MHLSRVHASSRACIRACTHLSQVCTHVLQIDALKLKLYEGNLTHVALNHVPELLSYFELAKLEKAQGTHLDGLGNGVSLEGQKKKATKADLKRVKKAIAEKRRSGIEVYTDEELDAAGLRAPFSPYD